MGNENIVDRTISLEKKLLFTIWVLSKPESFLAAGDRFGLAKSSSHGIFMDVITVLCNLMGQFIRWPVNHRQTITVCIQI